MFTNGIAASLDTASSDLADLAGPAAEVVSSASLGIPQNPFSPKSHIAVRRCLLSINCQVLPSASQQPKQPGAAFAACPAGLSAVG